MFYTFQPVRNGFGLEKKIGVLLTVWGNQVHLTGVVVHKGVYVSALLDIIEFYG